jgi:predicted nicotinamide N-methyase
MKVMKSDPVLEDMHYPNSLIEFQDGLMLYVPIPEKVKATYEQRCKLDASTAFPFWAKIWPSSKAMTQFLAIEPQWVKGKKMLEVGAGVGLPSFAIAHLAREVIVTDHAAEAVALINKNITHLCINNMKSMCLDWNDFPDTISADTILLSDVNYAPGAFGPLLTLIEKLIGKGAVIIIATPERIMAAPFVEALQPFIQRSFLHLVEEMGYSIEIRMLLLWKQ